MGANPGGPGPNQGPGPQEAGPAQIVTCPKCQAKYRLPQPIPANGLAFGCGHCRARLVVRPHAPASPPPGQAGPSASGPAGPPEGAQAPGRGAAQAVPAREAFCPSCLRPMAVALANGLDAWVDCPHCGEKFLAPANPALVSLGEGQKYPGFRPTRAKSRLVLKVDKMAQLYEIGIQESLPGQKRRLIMAAVAAFLLALSLYAYLLIHSWRDAASLAGASPLATEAGSRHPYGEEDFKADLLNFNRWARDKFLSNYSIDYSGHSSRLFKHAVSRLAPYECQDFTSLTLNAKKKAGVSITGHCYDRRLASPTISVEWRGREAIVSVPGSAEAIRVELFPGG